MVRVPIKDMRHAHIDAEDATYLYAFSVEKIGEKSRGLALQDKATFCRSCFTIYAVAWGELQLKRRET